MLGNPLRHQDPSGHVATEANPVPPQFTAGAWALIQQAIAYFTSQGWTVLGDPSQINPYWNGADLVFTAAGANDSIRTLAVELKDD